MRVHPTEYKSYGQRWQFAVAIVLLLAILGSTLLRGSGSSADAAHPVVPMRDVVIVKNFIAAGSPIIRDDLLVESRPVSTLPSDVVTSVSDFEGRVAAGPIPAGIPLSKTMLVGASEYSKKQTNEIAAVELGPVDIRLNAYRTRRWIEVAFTFREKAPAKGARVALYVQRIDSRAAVVVEEGWVATSTNNTASILVPPATALFVQEAKLLGSFSFFILPNEGDSPYKSEVISDINMLRVKLGMDTLEADRDHEKAQNKKRAEREVLLPSSFSSYAWVRGGDVRYALDKKGKLFVIENSGLVTPLYEFNLGLPQELFMGDMFGDIVEDDTDSLVQ